MRVELNTEEIKRSLMTIANAVVNEIRKRTLSGLDVDGKAFKKYSAQYAKKKTDTGRSDTVNLTYSGAMMGSITVRSYNEQAEIFIADNQRKQIAYKHNFGDGAPKREFFGVTEAKYKELYEKYFNKPFLRIK